MSTSATHACLVINDGPSKETLKELRSTVVAILNSKNADDVKIKALEVIQGASQTASKTVNNCHFEMKAK